MDRATIRQKKAGRPVRFELTDQTRSAVDEYLRLSGRKAGRYLFAGRGNAEHGLTARQHAGLVHEWVASIGLDPAKFGTHSLRRTKAVLIYRRTGNLRAVQLLLGHSKIESTVRYLGVEVDDAIAIAEKIDIGRPVQLHQRTQSAVAKEGRPRIRQRPLLGPSGRIREISPQRPERCRCIHQEFGTGSLRNYRYQIASLRAQLSDNDWEPTSS